MADFNIFLSDPDGVRKTLISQIITATYVRRQNDWGWATMVIPDELFDRSLIEVDAIIEIERRNSVGDPFVEEWVGLLRKWRFFDDPQGETNVEMSAMHEVELLNRRDIAYRSNRPEADKSGPADSVMKAFVNENAGAAAPVDEAGRPRSFGSEFFVEADAGVGPNVGRQGSFKNLLLTLKQISQSSITAGNSIYFDIQHERVGGLSTFTFKTFQNQIGTDRSVGTGTDPVVFSEARENLRDPSYEVDWSDEWNYIYGTGPGIGTDRIIDPEKNVPRHTLTKWSRRENHQDARGETTQLGVAIRAFERLQEERPRERFTGQLIDTPSQKYGVDWFFGDKATAEYLDKRFDGNIDMVSVTIKEDGDEEIVARLDSDDAATTG